MENITKEKLHELDPLTGLLNKKVFTEQTETYLHTLPNMSCYSFLIFDIDDFKNVNDQLGHPAGDRVIIQTGEMLKEGFGKNALIGRIRGDEFCVFLFETDSLQTLTQVLDDFFRQPLLASGQTAVTYSCGVVTSSISRHYSYDELYRLADELLYKAKQRGKNQYCMRSDNDGGHRTALPENSSQKS